MGAGASSVSALAQDIRDAGVEVTESTLDEKSWMTFEDFCAVIRCLPAVRVSPAEAAEAFRSLDHGSSGKIRAGALLLWLKLRQVRRLEVAGPSPKEGPRPMAQSRELDVLDAYFARVEDKRKKVDKEEEGACLIRSSYPATAKSFLAKFEARHDFFPSKSKHKEHKAPSLWERRRRERNSKAAAMKKRWSRRARPAGSSAAGSTAYRRRAVSPQPLPRSGRNLYLRIPSTGEDGTRHGPDTPLIRRNSVNALLRQLDLHGHGAHPDNGLVLMQQKLFHEANGFHDKPSAIKRFDSDRMLATALEQEEQERRRALQMKVLHRKSRAAEEVKDVVAFLIDKLGVERAQELMHFDQALAVEDDGVRSASSVPDMARRAAHRSEEHPTAALEEGKVSYADEESWREIESQSQTEADAAGGGGGKWGGSAQHSPQAGKPRFRPMRRCKYTHSTSSLSSCSSLSPSPSLRSLVRKQSWTAATA